MIAELVLSNVGNIDRARLNFAAGFTVITGETGAGKTMLLSALEILLGKRSGKDQLKSEKPLQVTGVWQLNGSGLFEDSGDEFDAGKTPAELIINRQLSDTGRGRASVNDQPVSADYLENLGKKLVSIHGQAGQLKLKSRTLQRGTLDKYAGNQLLLEEYATVWQQLSEVSEQIDEIVNYAAKRRIEAAGLQQALQEINAVKPEPDEDETVRSQIKLLESSAQLLENLRKAAVLLAASERGARDTLLAAQPAIASAAKLDPSINTESLDEAISLVEAISQQVAERIRQIPVDSMSELDELHSRLNALNQLQKKYGPSLQEVIDFGEYAAERHEELSQDDTRIDELKKRQQTLRAKAQQLADAISEKRRLSAAALAQVVTAELNSLAMPQAAFIVQIEAKELDAYGQDEITMLLQPHPNIPARPLNKGASGGEISRIMLAIEAVSAGADTTPTIIFDEIDSGIGGATAIEVGKRLGRLARHTQVIVITHSAQVAAFADSHLLVTKTEDVSEIRQLSADERIQEMARLLSGLSNSESGLTHARELLDTAARALTLPADAIE